MTPAQPLQPEQRGFPWLQVGRGFAALMVVLTHTSLNSQKYLGATFLGGLFGEGHGNLGVDFFFVLSGFIILHVHRADIGNISRLRNYARKRFTRVYPMYWLVTLLLLPAFFFAPKLVKGFDGDWLYVIKSILLLPQNELPILGVGWTLTHEVYFYALFGLCIVTPRRLWLPLVSAVMALTLWKLACDFGHSFNGTKYQTGQTFLDSSVLSAFLFSRHNVEFAMGALIALSIQQLRLPRAGLFMFAGYLLFMLPIVLDTFDLPGGHAILGDKSSRTLCYTLISALIILSSIQITRQTRDFTPPRWSRFVGDASYSLYLLHYPMLIAVFVAFKAAHLTHLLPASLICVIAIAIAVSASLLCYRYVERPLLTRSRGRASAPMPASKVHA